MDVSNYFGPRLREMRERSSLSQKELAERSGVSLRAISHWEQSLRQPSWGNVIALAAALGIDVTDFMKPPADASKPGRGRPPKKAEPEQSAAQAKQRGKAKKKG
jgi:transcriptional regulator with XRE-family HTH domain